jgi:DNA-binding beta-propeller fold protein YncE
MLISKVLRGWGCKSTKRRRRLCRGVVTRGRHFQAHVEPLEARWLLAVLPGDILIADSDADTVIQVDPTTGAQSTLSSGVHFVTPIGIAIDDVTGDIFVTDTGGAGVAAIIRVDPNTGGQTVVSSGGSLVDPFGIEIEADGLLIVADQNAGTGGSVIRVNRSTGAQTVVSTGGNFVDPNAIFDPSGVEVEASGDVLVADLNSLDGGSDGRGGGVGAVFRMDPTLSPPGNRTIVNDGSGSPPLDLESPSHVAIEPASVNSVSSCSNLDAQHDKTHPLPLFRHGETPHPATVCSGQDIPAPTLTGDADRP